MKKTLFYILLCGLSLLALSACKKEAGKGKGNEPAVSMMKGIFYTEATGADETLQLLPGKSRTVELKVRTQEGAVSDITVKASLKIAPEAVDTYNASHADAPVELLPSSAYSFVSNDMMLARYNTASTSAKVRITAAGLEDNVLYLLPLTIDKVEGTDNWALAENPYAYITVIQTNEGPEGGDGSKEYPYLLANAADMKAMKDKLSTEEKVYFRMTNDIDMAQIDDWEPLNYASPYDKAIDFDGGGFTIDNFHVTDFGTYASFFGVLNGYCHDVTFTNALIESGADSACGILAGYGGSGAIHADVARVHVQGKVTFTGNKTGIGGMIGTLGNAVIEASSADCEVVSGKNFVGGLYGYAKQDCVVSNCWTSGSVTGGQRVGGIGGGTDKTGKGVKIINCYSTAKVYGGFALGGIGGFYNLDNSDGTPDVSHPENTFENCIAWNEEIKANTTSSGDLSHYSCGMVVGYTSLNNTHTGCLRRPDALYNQVIFFDYSDAFSIYDQEDSSPVSPLMVQKVEGASYNYPYHGKAAASGATLSQVAQSLGWSADIWDFSGDIPVIRKDAVIVPEEDVHGESGIGDYDENNLN